MSVDLTTLPAPATPGKSGGNSGVFLTIILVIAGFLIYNFFSHSNNKAKEDN